MLLKTDAVVLKKNKYGEGDMILTLFSKKLGKLQAVHKASQRSRNRFSSGTQLFSYGEFVLFKGNNLYQVSQVDIKDSYYKLREDVEKLVHATYILELTNSAVLEGQTNNRLFNELTKCLHLLSSFKMDLETMIKAYEIKLLTYTGFKPELNQCVCCGTEGIGDFRFSIREGGILCKNCFSEDLYSFDISATGISVIQYLIHSELEQITRLKIKKHVLEELNKLMKPYITTYLDKSNFKSLGLLNSIKESKY